MTFILQVPYMIYKKERREKFQTLWKIIVRKIVEMQRFL